MRKNSILFKILCLLMALNLAHALQAQNTENSDGGCVSYRTLLSLIHINIGEAMDTLEPFDFKLGMSRLTDTVVDTIDYIPLRYRRTGFYNNSVPDGAEIMILQSLDGLSNYVEYSLKNRGDCNIMSELSDNKYAFDIQRSTLEGTEWVNNRIERYVFTVHQDNSLWVQCKYINEIEDFIRTRREQAVQRVTNAITQAQALKEQRLFAGALAVLDSVKGFYPPMDSSISSCYSLVQRSREIHYEELLDSILLQTDPVPTALGMLYCDTILTFNPDNKRVHRVRELLEARRTNSVASYQKFFPQTYEFVCKQLQDFVNTEIRSNFKKRKQELRMQFFIKTDYDNESNGFISLAVTDPKTGTFRPNPTRTPILQAEIDSIAKSPMIVPVREYNVNIRTEDTINAHVRWDYTTLKVDASKTKDSLLQLMVDSIEDLYMSETIISRTELEADGSFKQYRRMRLPTKRVYTFGWVNKETVHQSYNELYRDIYLMDFETARGLSWAPSLLIPGLGTYNQGARPDVISRALPFFLFGGIGVFGLFWETKIDHPKQELSDINLNPFYLKNFGYYLASAGLGISAIIYVNELIEGMSNSVKNSKRSKAIRAKLAEGPLLIDAQDVIIR